MAQRMSVDLMHEWMAYARIRPLAFSADYRQTRSDWNAGMLAAAFVNVLTGLWSKRPSRHQPGDFMFKTRPAVGRQKSSKELYLDFKTALLMSGSSKGKRA